MATLKTKYNLKDEVFNPYCVNEKYYITCEDCQGTGKWELKDSTKTIGCQTCSKDDNWYRTPGKVEQYKYFARVNTLTIGQITATIGYKKEIRYMCKETGLGSGSLWSEKDLVTTYEIAKQMADELAKRKNNGEKDIELDVLYVQCGGIK